MTTTFKLPKDRPWELVLDGDEIKVLTVSEDGESWNLEKPFRWECIRCGEKAVTPTPDPPAFCPQCNKRDVFKPRFPKEFRALHSSVWRVPWHLPPEPEPANPDWLYQDLRKCISKHVVFPREEEYDVYSAWTMASWLVDEFDTAPYILFRGEIESGKTRALEVIARLAYHTIPSVGITPAALRKQIAWFRCTCAIDQAEDQMNRKYEAGQAMYRLVLAGYKRGMYIVRCREKEPDKLEYDDPFSFKALASTRSFDQAIDSRCIIIDMEEAEPESKEIDEDWCARLRSHLLSWRLGTFELPDLKLDLKGRTRELFTPLLKVSELVGVRDQIEEFAKKHGERRRMEMVSEFKATMVGIIDDLMQRVVEEVTGEENKVYISDIKSVLSNRGVEIASTVIGRKLSDLDFHKKRSTKKGVYVDLSVPHNQAKLEYWKQKYHLVESKA